MKNEEVLPVATVEELEAPQSIESAENIEVHSQAKADTIAKLENLTDEEAETALENVNEMVGLLNYFKSLKERKKDKLIKMREKYDSLPDGHYKKKQLEFKMYDLVKEISPTIVWDSKAKGTYIKNECPTSKQDNE